MSRNDNLFKLFQLSTANEILIKDFQSVIKFFRITSYIWFNKLWNFIWLNNYMINSELSIWMSVWKNWFSIAWKNKLSNINICKSCSCKMFIIRIDIFNKVWFWCCLCFCCCNIRIVIMNYYHKSLSLYFEDNLSVLWRYLMLHNLL